MKTFTVALHVTTASLSLEELSKILGESGPGSHSKGGARSNRPDGPRFWKSTIWKTESTCDEDSVLNDHLDSLEQNFREIIAVRDRLPIDARLSLDIAVFYDTFYGTVSLSNAKIMKFVEQGLDIEVTACGETDFGAKDSG